MKDTSKNIKRREPRHQAGRSSFTVTLDDPRGLDGIPCALLCNLNRDHFPDCRVVVSKPNDGGEGLLESLESLMMLAVRSGSILKFQCDGDPGTFDILRQCICLLFRRPDKPGYGETYNECAGVLRKCRGRNPECLLQELMKVTELEAREPLLSPSPYRKTRRREKCDQAVQPYDINRERHKTVFAPNFLADAGCSTCRVD